jgi:hypothetical protein
MNSTRGVHLSDAEASFTQTKQSIYGLPKVSHENGNAIIYLQIKVGPGIAIPEVSSKEIERDKPKRSINETPSEKKIDKNDMISSLCCKPEVVKKKVIIKARMRRKKTRAVVLNTAM